MMDHRKFAARCKYLIAQRHREECQAPGDEMLPVLFVITADKPDQVVPVRIPDPERFMHSDVKGIAMEQVVKPMLMTIGATQVAFASEAWMVAAEVGTAAAQIYADPEGVPAHFMPSQRADRREVVTLFCASGDAASAHTAIIDRTPIGPPVLRGWEDSDPLDVDAPDLGQLGTPLRDAVRRADG